MTTILQLYESPSLTFSEILFDKNEQKLLNLVCPKHLYDNCRPEKW